MIHFVGDLEVGQNFLYLLGKLVWGEAHRVDVVGAAQQRLHRGFKDLQGGPQAVVYTAQTKKKIKEDSNVNITQRNKWLRAKEVKNVTNVHHWKLSVASQVALKTTTLDSCVENLDGIVWKMPRII